MKHGKYANEADKAELAAVAVIINAARKRRAKVMHRLRQRAYVERMKA